MDPFSRYQALSCWVFSYRREATNTPRGTVSGSTEGKTEGDFLEKMRKLTLNYNWSSLQKKGARKRKLS
jgi:hypothetical protein